MMDAFQRLLNFPEHLEVWRTTDGNIAVSFYRTSIKTCGGLLADFGVGISFYEACEDYLRKISGRMIVVEYDREYRKEFNVL